MFKLLFLYLNESNNQASKQGLENFFLMNCARGVD